MKATGEIKEMKQIGRRLREASRDLVESELPDNVRVLLQRLACVEKDGRQKPEAPLRGCETVR